MKFIPPFNVGDKVRVIHPGSWGMRYKRHEGIIESVQIEDVNKYSYALTCTAWWNHGQLELVHKCNEETIKQLLKDHDDEGDGL